MIGRFQRTAVAALVASSTALAGGGSSPFEGDLDPTLSGDGWFTISTSSNDDGRDAARLPEGRVVLVHTQAGAPAAAAVAVFPETFASSTGASFTLPDGGPVATHPAALAVQPDGRVVVAGTTGEIPSRGFVFRVEVSAAGQVTLDTSFGTGGFAVVSGGTGVRFHDVAVDGAGRIVAVGGFDNAAALNPDFFVVRFTAAGQPDSSFDGDGRKTVTFGGAVNLAEEATSVALDAAGRLVVAGRAATSSAGQDFAICRLIGSNGALDGAFDTDGRALVGFDLGGDDGDEAEAVALDGAGRILLAGRARDSDGSGHRAALARLTPAGQLDPGFDSDGRLTTFFGFAGANDSAQGKEVLLLPGDAVLLLGERLTLDLTTADLAAAAFDAAGAIDPDWGLLGSRIYNLGAYETLSSAFLQSGRPVLVGDRNTEALVVRLHRAQLFTDGFESGGTGGWSAAVP